MFVVSVIVNATRAKLIWEGAMNRITFKECFGSLVIGNFYNTLLPGKLGEGIRAWHFSKKTQVGLTQSFAAIVLEKWVEAQIFILLAVILFLLNPFAHHYILFTIAGTAGVVLLLTIANKAMLGNKQFAGSVWSGILSIKKLQSITQRLQAGYNATFQFAEAIKERGMRLRYFMLCISIFCLNGIQFFLLMKAAGVAQPVLGVYSAYLIVVSIMIIAFLPAAPGSIGVLHYGLYSALLLSASLHNIQPDAAQLQTYALFGVYVHLSYFLPEVSIGGFYVFRERKILFG